MYHILIVDDEAKIRELIKKYAEFEGYQTSMAENGMIALQSCQDHSFDLIVMDVMMPELDGFSAVKEIKKINNTPILMLSARGEEYDKIHGFELGIDDYVVKPFSGKELMMRIHAIISRSKTTEPLKETLQFGELRIDCLAHLVYVQQQRRALTPKEYDLLLYLVNNKNIVLTREQLLQEVWGFDGFGDDRTLDTHMKSLRKAIEPCGTDIVTVRGVGYRFEASQT